MQHSNLSKIFTASLLAISMATFPLSLPASAQVNAPTVDREEVYDNDNDNSDWGWLGLFGLIGLAGLAGRKRHETTTPGDTTPLGRSGYRE